MLAVSRAGLVHQPIDWRWGADERRRVALHLGADLVLVEPGEEPLPTSPPA